MSPAAPRAGTSCACSASTASSWSAVTCAPAAARSMARRKTRFRGQRHGAELTLAGLRATPARPLRRRRPGRTVRCMSRRQVHRRGLRQRQRCPRQQRQAQAGWHSPRHSRWSQASGSLAALRSSLDALLPRKCLRHCSAWPPVGRRGAARQQRPLQRLLQRHLPLQLQQQMQRRLFLALHGLLRPVGQGRRIKQRAAGSAEPPWRPQHLRQPRRIHTQQTGGPCVRRTRRRQPGCRRWPAGAWQRHHGAPRMLAA